MRTERPVGISCPGGDSEELAHQMRDGEPPILTVLGHPPVPRSDVSAARVARAAPSLVDSVRDRERHPGLAALHWAVDELRSAEGWNDLPHDVWRA